MIFPDLPKRINFEQANTYEAHEALMTVETPLRGVEQATTSSGITVQEWWIKHGLATDPAAMSSRNPEEPIDYWAADAWEFYALCTAMLCWIVYWWGLHHGAW